MSKLQSVDLGREQQPLPAWLVQLDSEKMLAEPFPLREVLGESVYYPACGDDGGPVRHLARWFPSFVYSDYGYTRQMFLKELEDKPFSHYRVIGMRSITLSELAPDGWSYSWLTQVEYRGLKSYSSYPNFTSRSLQLQKFCEWVIFERDASAPSSHGPERFSLLYLNVEGATAYKTLYADNYLRAAAIAVIQPGHGFGCNWSDFTDPQGALARAVMTNPAGVPDFYVTGGWGPRIYIPRPWPEYTEHKGWYDHHGQGSVRVWGGTAC